MQIQSKHIEIYSARFLINAQFSGLRYIMFHWPILSAAIGKSLRKNLPQVHFLSEYILGITSNLFFIALVCMLSWYQIIHSEEYQEFMKKKEDIDHEDDDGKCQNLT